MTQALILNRDRILKTISVKKINFLMLDLRSIVPQKFRDFSNIKLPYFKFDKSVSDSEACKYGEYWVAFVSVIDT